MKSKIIMMLLLLAATVVSVNGQKKVEKKDVPKVVYSTFGEFYPNATVEKWEAVEYSGYDEWEKAWKNEMGSAMSEEVSDPDAFYVTYKYKNNESRSIFYRDGKWMETSTKIKKENLPKIVTDAVANSEYKTWNMADFAYLIERPLGEMKEGMAREDMGNMMEMEKDAFYKVYLKGGLKRHILKVNMDGSIRPKPVLLGEL